MKGNAKITSTMLGYEDHGILTCFLLLDQSGSCQGFGGFRIDAPKDKNFELCCFWIKRILSVVGVDSWEKLPGNYIRVDGEEYGDIFGIGHITDDKWFYPKKEIKELMDNLNNQKGEKNEL